MRPPGDNSAKVTEEGLITSDKRGEAFIFASFATFTKASQVIVIPDNLKYSRPKLPEQNYIDTLVNQKLHRLRILPSELCSDEVFLRRVHLDIVGLLPTRQEYERFVCRCGNSPLRLPPETTVNICPPAIISTNHKHLGPHQILRFDVH